MISSDDNINKRISYMSWRIIPVWYMVRCYAYCKDDTHKSRNISMHIAYLLKLIWYFNFLFVFSEIFLWWEIDIWSRRIISVSLHMSYCCPCCCLLHKDSFEDSWRETSWEHSLVSCIIWWSQSHYSGKFWFNWT